MRFLSFFRLATSGNTLDEALSRRSYSISGPPLLVSPSVASEVIAAYCCSEHQGPTRKSPPGLVSPPSQVATLTVGQVWVASRQPPCYVRGLMARTGFPILFLCLGCSLVILAAKPHKGDPSAPAVQPTNY